jgi:hypothetical protein
MRQRDLVRLSIVSNNQRIEMGKFMHACEGEMVCESINPKVPQFNAQMFLENKVRCSERERRRSCS